MMADLLNEIKNWMLEQIEGLPIYLGKLPASPVNAAALFETGGDPHDYCPQELFRFRVIARAITRAEALELADSIFILFRSAPDGGAAEIDLNNFHVYRIFVRRPQLIGVDETNRPMYGFDCEANIRPIS